MRRTLAINAEEQHTCRDLAAPTPIRGTMNIHSSNIQGQSDGEREDKGFTLIEILIAIVLVGILSAVAVVGISNLVSKGGKSACTATQDASTAASAVYFASTGGYPINFSVMTAGSPPALTLQTGVAVGATPFTTLTGSGWTLTMSPIGSTTTAPGFSGC
jgi:prepilin-type N-terminal cleavage/methylation domain-containing protein